MNEYFDERLVGVLCDTDYASDGTTQLRAIGDVYSCKKCGALVLSESRDIHAAEHKTMEQLLTLAHQLTDTVQSIHTAVSRTHHL